MRVVYISGPMSGVDYMEAAKLASSVQAHLTEKGIFTFNPYGSGLDESAWGVSKEKWLENDFHWIGFCDSILLLPGWYDSEGCMKELVFASRTGCDVYIWRNNSPELV